MKRIGWLLALVFLAPACGVGQPVNLQATIRANEAQARAIQTQVAQANAVIAAQQTQVAATMQAVATLFAPAVSPSSTPAEENFVATLTPTPMPTPTPEPLHSLTFTTPKGIQVTLHRAWWALRVEDFTPTEGKVFLILDLTLQNPGEETIQDYALPLYASVHTAQGYLFRPVPLPLAQSLEFVTLAPHDRRRGLLVFALYPDEGPFTLSIQDAPLDRSSQPVQVRLNPVPLPPTPVPSATETPVPSGAEAPTPEAHSQADELVAWWREED